MTLDQWRQLPFNVLDLESTGVNSVEDRIVQAAFVTFVPGQRPRVRQWLVDPKIEIPKGASDVHGITTAQVQAHGQAPDVVLFELTGLIALALGHGIPLVAFNAAYDLTMVEAECRRHGVDTLASRFRMEKIQPVIDPFVIDKQISRRRGKRTLGDQCRHYTVPHTGAHDASGDALATGRLLPKVLEAASRTQAYAEVVDWTPLTLHGAQIQWRREQCDSLRKYFDGKQIEHDGVPGAWPVLPAAYDVEPLAVAS